MVNLCVSGLRLRSTGVIWTNERIAVTIKTRIAGYPKTQAWDSIPFALTHAVDPDSEAYGGILHSILVTNFTGFHTGFPVVRMET